MKIVITDEVAKVLHTLTSFEEIIAFLHRPGPEVPQKLFSEMNRAEKDLVYEQTCWIKQNRALEYLFGAIAADTIGEIHDPLPGARAAAVSGTFTATLIEDENRPEQEIDINQLLANPEGALEEATSKDLIIVKDGKRLGVLSS